MDFEEKRPCPKVDIDGMISNGKQFDLDITLPEDHRDVIYGVVKDCFKEPVCDAVVKLVEIVYDCGKEERRPVGHTFTDKEGEFVFGPLCPDRKYAIQIWVNDTKKIKICAKCHHEGKCLKGDKMKCDWFMEEKCDEWKDKQEHEKCDCKEKHEHDECKCKDEHEHDKCECKEKHDECKCKEKHEHNECECKERPWNDKCKNDKEECKEFRPCFKKEIF